MEKNTKEKIVNNNLMNIIVFLIVFVCMIVYLIGYGNMSDISGDAADSWKTITSWTTEQKYGGYTLYKGLIVLYPYLWMYSISNVFNVDEWLLINVYFAFLYSFFSTVILPKVIELFLRKRVHYVTRGAIGGLGVFFWNSTYALTQIMVDLPTATFYSLLLMLALQIVEEHNNKWWIAIASGLFAGIGLFGSGQYSIATMILIIIVCIYYFKECRDNKSAFQCVCLFILIIILWSVLEYCFQTYQVNPLKAEGFWLYTRKEGREMYMIPGNQFIRKFSGPDIKSNRAIYAIASYLKISNSQMEEIVYYWNRPMSTGELIKAFISHPMDFIVTYFNRLVVIFSPITERMAFIPLMFFYSMLFLTLRRIKMQYISLKDLADYKFFCILSVLATLIGPVVVTVEMRYVMVVQGLIMILGIEEMISLVMNKIETMGKEDNTCRYKINYELLMGFVFVFFMFSYYACVTELGGTMELFSWM